MSAVKTFVDTNVLLYSLDARDLRKRDIARQLIEGLCKDGSGYLSRQVINEFASNLIRKFGRTPADVSKLCEDLSDFRIDVGGLAQVQEALRIMGATSISFWDACIIASAISAGCRVILTEDLAAAQVIAGITVVNPFR